MTGPLTMMGNDAAAACEGGVCAIPEPAPKLTLISFPTCPFVQRAVIALKERGVDFEVIYIDLSDKPDWFLAISPLGKVPVLKVEPAGEKPAILFESTVILAYLDETLPGPRLFPDDALARARQRSWIEYAGTVLADLYKLWQAGDAEAYAAARDTARNRLAVLEHEVEGPFYAGDGFSAVDAVYAPVFRQIDAVETVAPTGLLDGLPRLNDWRRALAARPSVRDAVPADFTERHLKRLRDNGAHVLSRA